MCISTLAHIFGERERSIQSNDPLPCLMWLLFCVLVDLASEMQKKKKKYRSVFSRKAHRMQNTKHQNTSDWAGAGAKVANHSDPRTV